MDNKDINAIGTPTTPVVQGVSVDKYNEDVKSAKGKGFLSGLLSTLVIVLLSLGGLYFFSGFGEQNQWQFTEPDYELPELNEEVIKESGDIDAGNTDVETVDE